MNAVSRLPALIALRQRLLGMGYHPVPVHPHDAPVKNPGKQPIGNAWQKRAAAATPDHVASWPAGNTGLLCGDLIGLDMDVLEPALAAQVDALAERMLGATPLHRIGKAPKRLRCYRAAVPMAKSATPELFLADGTKVQVEVLGEGQQMVAYGIHPETLNEYEWPLSGPDVVPLTDLPLVAPETLRGFLAAVEAMLRGAGGLTAKEREDAAQPREAASRGGPKGAKGRSQHAPLTVERVADALRHIPNNDLHYDDWVRIGYALHHGLADDGQHLWCDWSARSSKDDPAATLKHWSQFRPGGSGRASVTIGTLFHQAKQNGWKPQRSPGRAVALRTGAESRRESTAPAAAEPAKPSEFEVTEDGIALAFTARHAGQLRYCHHTGAWYVWTGQLWRKEDTKLAFSWARQTCRELARGAAPDDRPKIAKASFAAAVERFAQSDRAFAVTSEVWDRDPWLLGTPRGTVDLRTGRMRAAAQADCITKATAVAPADRIECPVWLKFLRDATAGDGGLIAFLQQWCGYMLTGDTREHALLFIYGPGGNGKSVLLNTVAAILADYARTSAMETFAASQSDRHPTDLAMLKGARMVCASETEEGRAWAEVRIKQLTGGDTISARFMRQDFFEFRPAFKLVVIGNHKPVLKNVDEAARRRFNVVPFVHKPADPDRELEAKLQAEWPGILRWMIEGCLAWQRGGLVRPQVVLDATAEYFEAQDYFGRWLAECCDLIATMSTKPAHLLHSFQKWCEGNGEPMSDNRRLRGMIERTSGLKYATVRGTQWVRGIVIKPPAKEVQPDE